MKIVRCFVANINICVFIPLLVMHSAHGQEIFTMDDSGTAPDAFIWYPQSDVAYRGPMVISQNLADFSTKSYPDESDPTMFWGYNHLLGGNEIVAGEGAVFWGVEGNYRHNPALPAYMEAYVHFIEPWTSVGHRPIMIRFDKGLGEIDSVDLVSGHQNLGRIRFYGQESGGNGELNATFKARSWTMHANDGTGDLNLELESPGGYNHSRIWLGSADVEKAAMIEANRNTHLYIGWSSAASAPLHLRRKPGANGDITVLGVGGNQNSAVLGVTQANAADNTPAVAVTSKQGSTVELVRFNDSSGKKALTIDTEQAYAPAITVHDPSAGAIPRYKLHKNGYVAVREAGNNKIDREPSSGATRINPSWNNKPGPSSIGEPQWFPMLDANGNLFWVPGYPD